MALIEIPRVLAEVPDPEAVVQRSGGGAADKCSQIRSRSTQSSDHLGVWSPLAVVGVG
jgi:hypothetical protein